MVAKKKVTCSPPPPGFLFSDDVPRLFGPGDEASRMGDEGCPNETPSVDDATGYSKEEEEATSVNCEEFL
jgi:hypothetical protein